ncbi:MAG: UDP-N-acetylmuramoylalanine--D-glutamate ligase [Epulopiscium sp. Nuni2H_MBin003]|nr:MAG: UDP-N-acetylmuramoylalanine--D-glutamate ligase [Epulopiscium sp. Nuni2H_MBin003]
MLRMNILVVGCARSGIGAAKLAVAKEHKVTIYDKKKLGDFDNETRQSLLNLSNLGVDLQLNSEDYKHNIDKVVVSPGVPLEIDIIKFYKQAGIEIVGEFEFASTFCKAPIIGITGTNGKTTTTSLVGEIFKAYNPNTYVVGNIGRAFSEEVLDIKEDGIVIAELSSFQLETIKTLKCEISAILNISPDHLNRHHTMENYIQAKYRIFENPSAINKLILNYEDTELRKLVGNTKKEELYFSAKQEIENGTYLKNGFLIDNTLGDNLEICHIDDMHILGEHNYENALAAILIARAYKVPSQIIKEVLINFRGVEHRIEYVNVVNNIKFYNDSKATNVGAAIPALHAMRSKIRLIGGGLDKDIEFDEWIKLFDTRVAKIYLIGETTNQIIETCKKYNFNNYQSYETLEEATIAAYTEANSGECVLLSPACASWDMFKSYEVRGELFKKVVNSLKEGETIGKTN